MSIRQSSVAFPVFVVALLVGDAAASQDGGNDQARRFQEFSQRLSGATLVGSYTIDGQMDGQLHKEEYFIRSVTKMDETDFWLFQARIKYGKYDVTLPIPLRIQWAGATPVITLDRVKITRLGTFDARVVIDGQRYAGTWRHDDVGGHMFGNIKKAAEK